MTQLLQTFVICPNIMIIRDQKILLLRRVEKASLFAGYWHVPTGRVEENESPKQAIVREVALWDKKVNDLETSYADRLETLEKQHKREEEEYKYALELARRQEAQEYTLKQEALEKTLEEKRQDLAQKESHIESRLTEIEALKEKVQKFPEELARETKRTAEEITEKLESQHKFAVTLKEKEIEGEKKLNLQKIASLEAKVKEQDAFIAQLTQKANDATQQVQTIACKALEASSQRLPYSSYGEKVQEFPQQRHEKQAS